MVCIAGKRCHDGEKSEWDWPSRPTVAVTCPLYIPLPPDLFAKSNVTEKV